MAKTGNRDSGHVPSGRNALLATMELYRLPSSQPRQDYMVTDRRGRLQALCFFYLEKYAGTIFYLCGTRKGRDGERGERGSREMENSRRAGFSLLRYANKGSEHDSETELINVILISREGSSQPT